MTNSEIHYIPEEDKDRLVIIPYRSRSWQINYGISNESHAYCKKTHHLLLNDNNKECMDLEQDAFSIYRIKLIDKVVACSRYEKNMG
jgi:hypothetical protein